MAETNTQPAEQLPAQTPEWTQSADISAQFARLTEPHRQKKLRTILAIIDARMSSRSEETVWKLDGTCSRDTYHTAWKKDPVFAEVLATAYTTAQHWQDGEAARAIQKAAKRLKLTAPVAVARLAGLLNSNDESIIIRAANSILDRADMDTASQTVAHATASSLDEWRAAADARRAQVDALEAAEWSEAEMIEITGAGALEEPSE